MGILIFVDFFVGYQVKCQNNSNNNIAKIPTQLNQSMTHGFSKCAAIFSHLSAKYQPKRL